MTAAELIDLLIAKGPALRATGIKRLGFEGFDIEFADSTGEQSPALASKPEPTTYSDLPDLTDPLDDPATFGRRDGSVPGFKRTSREED